MDRATHRRYLAYRETFPYFRPGSEMMLSMDEFEALDGALAELDQAEAASARGERPPLDDDDVALVTKLKKLLLRD